MGSPSLGEQIPAPRTFQISHAARDHRGYPLKTVDGVATGPSPAAEFSVTFDKVSTDEYLDGGPLLGEIFYAASAWFYRQSGLYRHTLVVKDLAGEDVLYFRYENPRHFILNGRFRLHGKDKHGVAHSGILICTAQGMFFPAGGFMSRSSINNVRNQPDGSLLISVTDKGEGF